MSTQAIGIDFGTAKTLVAHPDPHEKRPEPLRLEAQEKVFTGGEVREAVITRPVSFSPEHADALATKGEE